MNAVNRYGSFNSIADNPGRLSIQTRFTKRTGSVGYIKRRLSVVNKDSLFSCCRHHYYSKTSFLTCRCALSTAVLFLFVLVTYSCIRHLRFAYITADVDIHSYDFIVVGSGPAGSIIARTLSDNGYDVLLLEAGEGTQYDLKGPDYFSGPLTRFDIPLFWTRTLRYVSYNWVEYLSPGIFVGKGLGGTGIHSAMLYLRAVQEDIERWRIPSWTWPGFLQEYLDLEKYSAHPVPPYHSSSGPIMTTKPNKKDLLGALFVSSAVALGIPFTEDFNRPGGRSGVGYFDFNINCGVRDSVAKQYLGPMLISPKSFPKLDLSMRSTAHKILLQEDSFPGEHIIATGVEFVQDGKKKIANLKASWDHEGALARSVILCAGSIFTPQLLMASGIGPRQVLEEASVEVLVEHDNIGRGLQAHIAVGVVVTLAMSVGCGTSGGGSWAETMFDYVDAVGRSRTGEAVPASAFGCLGGTDISAGAFLASPLAEVSGSGSLVPDIQITVHSSVDEPHFSSNEAWGRSRNASIDQPAVLLTASLLYPDVRSQVTLNATCLTCAIVERSTALSARDVDRLAWAVRRIREILLSSPIRDSVRSELFPGSDVETAEALAAWVRDSAYHTSNWVGSAALGPNEKESVVDEWFRVRSVRRLRIADASVIPSPPSGNIQATVAAVAKKAAQAILAQRVLGRSRIKSVVAEADSTSRLDGLWSLFGFR